MFWRVVASAVVLSVTSPAWALFPVVDEVAEIQWGTSILNQIKQYGLQTKQYVGEQLSWAVQAQQYAMQGQQYVTEAQQLYALAHNPSLGGAMYALNQAGLGSSLPVDPYTMMSLTRGSGLRGGIPNIGGILAPLASLARSSYDANHIYTPTDGGWNSQQLIANADANAAQQATAMAAYDDLQRHARAMTAIRARLLTASTPKDVQDLQAQLALEQLYVANAHASLQAVQVTQVAQNDSRAQRDNESLDKGIDSFLAEAAAAGRGL
jgi:hypothetical protein